MQNNPSRELNHTKSYRKCMNVQQQKTKAMYIIVDIHIQYACICVSAIFRYCRLKQRRHGRMFDYLFYEIVNLVLP